MEYKLLGKTRSTIYRSLEYFSAIAKNKTIEYFEISKSKTIYLTHYYDFIEEIYFPNIENIRLVKFVYEDNPNGVIIHKIFLKKDLEKTGKIHLNLPLCCLPYTRCKLIVEVKDEIKDEIKNQIVKIKAWLVNSEERRKIIRHLPLAIELCGKPVYLSGGCIYPIRNVYNHLEKIIPMCLKAQKYIFHPLLDDITLFKDIDSFLPSDMYMFKKQLEKLNPTERQLDFALALFRNQHGTFPICSKTENVSLYPYKLEWSTKVGLFKIKTDITCFFDSFVVDGERVYISSFHVKNFWGVNRYSERGFFESLFKLREIQN